MSIDGGAYPKWSLDNEVFFAAGLSLMVAKVRELEGGDVEIERPEKVATLPPTLPAGYPFDVTPDGSRFITMRAKAGETRTVIRLIENWDATAE